MARTPNQNKITETYKNNEKYRTLIARESEMGTHGDFSVVPCTRKRDWLFEENCKKRESASRGDSRGEERGEKREVKCYSF